MDDCILSLSTVEHNGYNSWENPLICHRSCSDVHNPIEPRKKTKTDYNTRTKRKNNNNIFLYS